MVFENFQEAYSYCNRKNYLILKIDKKDGYIEILDRIMNKSVVLFKVKENENEEIHGSNLRQ